MENNTFDSMEFIKDKIQSVSEAWLKACWAGEKDKADALQTELFNYQRCLDKLETLELLGKALMRKLSR